MLQHMTASLTSWQMTAGFNMYHLTATITDCWQNSVFDPDDILKNGTFVIQSAMSQINTDTVHCT